MAGYHIGCSISPGGDVVASGSADGCLYFYDWNGASIIKIIQVKINNYIIFFYINYFI